MFKLDNFGVILFVSFSYTNCYNVHFMKIEKIDAKIDFSAKNSKKFVYYNEELVTNSNFKRNYLENYNDSEHAVKTKNAPFFMIFPNISFFHMVVNYWTGVKKPHARFAYPEISRGRTYGRRDREISFLYL